MSSPSGILLVTADQVAGREIVQCLGLVRGSAVRGSHVGRDIFAFMKNMVGGEIDEYTKLMAEAREQALDRMAAEARAHGADAVVGLRFALVAGARALQRHAALVVTDLENRLDFFV